jgi:hypothetical protein
MSMVTSVAAEFKMPTIIFPPYRNYGNRNKSMFLTHVTEITFVSY